MKTLLIIIFYMGVFMGFFFLLSAIGLLWCDSYTQIIRDANWFMCYTILIGWWIAMIPTHEISEKYDIEL